MEMRGVEPRTFHMRSERSTTELHPRYINMAKIISLMPQDSLHTVRKFPQKQQQGRLAQLVRAWC